MTETRFSLDGKEFIDLSSLLKILTLVGSGGEAKIRIVNGEAMLNGEVETRRKKKLRPGDVVEFGEKIIRIDA